MDGRVDRDRQYSMKFAPTHRDEGDTERLAVGVHKIEGPVAAGDFVQALQISDSRGRSTRVQLATKNTGVWPMLCLPAGQSLTDSKRGYVRHPEASEKIRGR